MKVVNIYEAKARLSECLDAAAAGERVLICKRNQPVAELRAIAAARTTPRPIGKASGRMQVPPAFFDPLPDEVIDDFAGVEEPRRPDAARARVTKAPGANRVNRPRKPKR